jgi:hypothetical protein
LHFSLKINIKKSTINRFFRFFRVDEQTEKELKEIRKKLKKQAKEEKRRLKAVSRLIYFFKNQFLVEF